jgi:rhamnosyltransferase
MNVEDIMAVVISYNGRETIKRTILAIVGQVGHLHVVDNGSEPDSIEILDLLEREYGISIERLGSNRGVGHALNLGIAHAKAIGCTWLLTMDQDSIADSGMISAYQSAVMLDPEAVSLSPRISKEASVNDSICVEMKSAITSGNLVHIGVFDKIGTYDEGFFIDCIDFDFSLRLRRAGYKLLRVEKAEMQHQLGEPTKLPMHIAKFYARHSSLRRYYMTRNYLYLAERHLLHFPVFIIKLGILRIVLSVLMLFLDRDPLSSYRAVARGLCDYVTRRHGPYRGATI